VFRQTGVRTQCSCGGELVHFSSKDCSVRMLGD